MKRKRKNIRKRIIAVVCIVLVAAFAVSAFIIPIVSSGMFSE